MRNIRIRLAYDGTNYCGWQVQSNGASIQAAVEKSILLLTGTPSALVAAGRTDAGVHAIGQVAHFRTESTIPVAKIRPGLQSYLPRDISVLDAEEVALDFHARYQAVRKRYRYVIDNSPQPLPFLQKYAYQLRDRFDVEAMHAAGQALVGEHDFRSFESRWPNRPDQRANGRGADRGAEEGLAGLVRRSLRSRVGKPLRIRSLRWKSWPTDSCTTWYDALWGRCSKSGAGSGPKGMSNGSSQVKTGPEPESRFPLTACISCTSTIATVPFVPTNMPVRETDLTMKVVHIITRLILGGAQENTLLTVEDQHRDWHDDVTLITGPGLGPEGSLIERAQAGGLDLRIIPQMRRNIHFWRDWSSYRALVRLLREIRPEIVHTHSSKAGIMGRLAAHHLGIPAVHTIHGPSFYPSQNPLAYQFYRQLEIWAARRCERLISVCDAMTDQYVAENVAPRSKFVTVYSGMDVEQFLSPRRAREVVRGELGFQPQQVVVGKVARLFELKGHEYVIEAARMAVKDNPYLRFLFVGNGLLQGQLTQQIAHAGLAGHFVFTGLVPSDQVPELIGAMDIVVHASLREGLARVLPQGLIAGKPVVSYDVDGAREVVITGETGYLLAPKSVAELAAAINELAADSTLRERLGQTGRARFTEQFRHQNMTRQLREIYADVIAGR